MSCGSQNRLYSLQDSLVPGGTVSTSGTGGTGGIDQHQEHPGNLYRYLKRLVQDGLVAEAESRPEPEADDERRRYYRVTELGHQVLNLEVGRLRALIEGFESTGLVPRRDARN